MNRPHLRFADEPEHEPPPDPRLAFDRLLTALQSSDSRGAQLARLDLLKNGLRVIPNRRAGWGDHAAARAAFAELLRALGRGDHQADRTARERLSMLWFEVSHCNPRMGVTR